MLRRFEHIPLKFTKVCYMSLLILTRFYSMCWTCFVRTASDSSIKMLCYADFNIHRSSRRKWVTYLDWNSTGYWLCVLYLLCKYVKWFAYFFKCFVTQTLTYIAQVDENVLHICIETQQVIDYICWTCFVNTSSESRIKMFCYARFNIYRSSWRKCVTCLFWYSPDFLECVELAL